MDTTIFKSKKYVTNSIFIKKALSLGLSLEEFLMLTYFDNDYNSFLDIDNLSQNIGINIDKAYTIFNSLLSKKLITIETTKDIEGRMIEKVNLDNFYAMLSEDKIITKKEAVKTDIYSIFEREFGRTITSMEYEIINAWLEKSYTEELIVGALKEAVYNQVTNLRYIDKILYEWSKKGFKTMEDVNKHLENKEKQNDRKELFDYNWLDDEE
ncbi:MAG: DnaD domain protein [Bacilli bacterium]|jgi:DNA replication protein|nr:DnaD domain protein [Bacilli bacterium]